MHSQRTEGSPTLDDYCQQISRYSSTYLRQHRRQASCFRGFRSRDGRQLEERSHTLFHHFTTLSWRLTASHLLALAAMGACHSGEVSLHWESVNDPRIASYEVHFGNAPNSFGRYLSTTDTSALVSGLEPGWKYYFAARSCTEGKTLCSGFSNMVCSVIPYVPHESGDECMDAGDSILQTALPGRGGWRVILQ